MFFRSKKGLLWLAVFLLLLSVGLGYLDDKEKKTYRIQPLLSNRSSGVETTNLDDFAIHAEEDYEYTSAILNNQSGRSNYSEKKLVVSEDFCSNLPIVIIDTNGVEPVSGITWDIEKGYFVHKDEDPFVAGNIKILDSTNDVNRLTDSARTESLLRMRVRGNSSSRYDKKQWLIKLCNENGKKKNVNLLGMGSDDEWVLNISFADKSLLRNHLAYQIANQIMGYAPANKYCEVVWKDGETYYYQGVYLLMHSVKVSDQRVNIPKYSENTKYVPALFRRDRMSDTDLILDEYGVNEGYYTSYIGVEYPNQEILSETAKKKISDRINEFEQVLFSEDWDTFRQYENYVDIDSFVDYFIINEFFLNYDAGFNSTYFSMDYAGKIHMGPVWDFDQGIDNATKETAHLETTAFHESPWFRQMLKDPRFTERIINRYALLRKSILSDKAIAAYIQEVVDYLGPAVDRDWARWDYYYRDTDYMYGEDYEGYNRNTKTYAEEIDRLQRILFGHAAWMDKKLDSLYQFKMISLEDATGIIAERRRDYRSALAVVFVFVFFLSIQMVLRYEGELQD